MLLLLWFAKDLEENDVLDVTRLAVFRAGTAVYLGQVGAGEAVTAGAALSQRKNAIGVRGRMVVLRCVKR